MRAGLRGLGKQLVAAALIGGAGFGLGYAAGGGSESRSSVSPAHLEAIPQPDRSPRSPLPPSRPGGSRLVQNRSGARPSIDISSLEMLVEPVVAPSGAADSIAPAPKLAPLPLRARPAGDSTARVSPKRKSTADQGTLGNKGTRAIPTQQAGEAATLHPESAAALHTESAAALHPESAAALHTESAAALHTESAAALHTESAAALHTEGTDCLGHFASHASRGKVEADASIPCAASSLAAEARLLESVRQALRSSPAEARRMLSSYDRRYPQGQLKREAKLLGRRLKETDEHPAETEATHEMRTTTGRGDSALQSERVGSHRPAQRAVDAGAFPVVWCRREGSPHAIPNGAAGTIAEFFQQF